LSGWPLAISTMFSAPKIAIAGFADAAGNVEAGLGSTGDGGAATTAQDGDANAYAATPRLSREAKDAYAAVTRRVGACGPRFMAATAASAATRARAPARRPAASLAPLPARPIASRRTRKWALRSAARAAISTSTPVIGITPYTALQSTVIGLPAYAETATSGGSTFALNYAARTVTATRSELGAKFDKAILVSGGSLTLKVKTAWAHDWNSDPEATATFQSLPGASFTVGGAMPAPDSALFSAGAEMRWRNGFALSGLFEGEFSDTTQSYEAKGTLRYAFN